MAPLGTAWGSLEIVTQHMSLGPADQGGSYDPGRSSGADVPAWTPQKLNEPQRGIPPRDLAGYAEPSFDLDEELENLEVEGKVCHLARYCVKYCYRLLPPSLHRVSQTWRARL
jgi:hypothetical protein